MLEGPLAAIERTFERIQCDARHDDVTVLQIAPIERRAFPDWSMAFAGTAPSGDTAGGQALARALSGAAANAGADIVAALRELVQREPEWAV